MSSTNPARPRALICGLVLAVALLAQPGFAAPVTGDDHAPVGAAFAPATDAPEAAPAAPAALPAIRLSGAIKTGRWSQACAIATNTLASENTVPEALEIFALCAALTQDVDATHLSLRRLQETEGPDSYYGNLVQGVVSLLDRHYRAAASSFDHILLDRPDDPLALYFRGSTLRAEDKAPEAASDFHHLIQQWPDFAPGLAASADLIAGPHATQQQLQSAIALTEHAAHVEPMNRAYWTQLAKLYDRSGDPSRASAVRLQWLSEGAGNPLPDGRGFDGAMTGARP